MDNWMEVTSVISNIATAIGVIVILFAFYTYSVDKKHLNLNTITRCIDIYRNKYLSIQPDNIELIKSYLDFVNEELFYFENNYLPKAIADEFIDGMIDIVPLFNKYQEIINKGNGEYYNSIINDDLLSPYPRIKSAFTFKDNYEMTKIFSEDKKIRDKARKKMISETLKNLGYRWWKQFI